MDQPSLFELIKTPSKTCTKCGETKPLDAFRKRKFRSGNEGRTSRCIDCLNAKNRAAYAANPGPTLLRTKAWAEANPDVKRGASRKSMAKRRAERPEDVREIDRRWRRNNPEQARESDRRKIAKNPELYRAINNARQGRRRARKERAFFEDVHHAKVWERDNGICHLCGLPADPDDWHLEHIVPLSKGGAHSYQNCAVSHDLCNWSKNDRYTPSAQGMFGAYTLTPTICL